MGRPIKKKWFGDTAEAGLQLSITAKLPGFAVGEGFIVEQTGTKKYKVNIGGNIGDVFLVNKSDSAELADGEGQILATLVSSGGKKPIFKITQYQVSVFNDDGTFSTYIWANNKEADIFSEDDPRGATATAVIDGGVIVDIIIDDGGQGYESVPNVTINGDGDGATATAAVEDGEVTGITVDNGGSEYTEATVVIDGP